MEVREFRAMGSRCRIVVDGGPADLGDRALQLVEELERRWSRFLPDSEVSRINAAPDHLHLVSADTYELIERADAARRATDGTYNPLMLDQLERAGYRRSWSDGPLEPQGPGQAGSVEPIELFPELNAVRLPSGTRFDPGGIGKGLAVDKVSDFIAGFDVVGASVELGGDLRVMGTPWYGPVWRIGIAHPLSERDEIGAFTPVEGAVCTSTRLKRRWRAGEREYHHLLDPCTGEPAVTDLVSVSTCSATAAWAEVVAKVALVRGSTEALTTFEELRVSGMAVTADGRVFATSSTGVGRVGAKGRQDLEGVVS